MEAKLKKIAYPNIFNTQSELVFFFFAYKVIVESLFLIFTAIK